MKKLNFGVEEKQFLTLLEKAISKTAPKKEFGLLFSGGIDSTLLAIIFKRLGLKFRCFFGFVKGPSLPKDLEPAKAVAKALGLKLEIVSVSQSALPKLLAETISLINSTSPVQVGVAIPLTIACRKAKKAGIKTVFSGMGADELFAGYAKFRNEKNISSLSKKLLAALPSADFARDKAIAKASNLSVETPFLNPAVVKFALLLPKNKKLSASRNKIIIRELAISLGLPKELSERKKVAAQYGSNSDKAIAKLSKQKGKKYKAAYLAGLAKN